MPLIAGEIDIAANFLNPDCMARYIDDQLDPIPSVLPGVDRLTLLHSRRKFLIQLSEGIINYLKVHATDSVIVTTACTGGTSVSTTTIL